MVFGLDHMVTEQEASQEEIDAIKKFLKREGTCLILSPHHDVVFLKTLISGSRNINIMVIRSFQDNNVLALIPAH
jgi:hypothetical protein